MRLRQFYNVGYYEAEYYNNNKKFYFDFKDNSTIVRIFPLEDYKNIDPNVEMEVYNLGVLYIDEDTNARLEDTDGVFKSIPDVYTSVTYSKEPITIKTTPTTVSLFFSTLVSVLTANLTSFVAVFELLSVALITNLYSPVALIV